MIHDVDTGYTVFSLTEKPRIIQDTHGKFTLINERTCVENTLYNMMAATCKPLHLPIKTLIANVLYQCEEDVYLVAAIAPELLDPYKDRQLYIDAYADIPLENYLNIDAKRNKNITVVY